MTIAAKRPQDLGDVAADSSAVRVLSRGLIAYWSSGLPKDKKCARPKPSAWCRINIINLLVERIYCEVIVKEYLVTTCLVLNKVVNILYWSLTTPIIT